MTTTTAPTERARPVPGPTKPRTARLPTVGERTLDNGLRVIINDYAEKDSTRFWLKMLLYTSSFLVLVLGTLVIFTFDPDLAG